MITPRVPGDASSVHLFLLPFIPPLHKQRTPPSAVSSIPNPTTYTAAAAVSSFAGQRSYPLRRGSSGPSARPLPSHLGDLPVSSGLDSASSPPPPPPPLIISIRHVSTGAGRRSPAASASSSPGHRHF
uniref:Uncharacterized protein n=1 Tax=Leersia perrieri TaxID=77586 RepID=A0A0D9WYR7_9ORYZ